MSDEAKPEWPAIYEKCDACGATIHCQHEDALSKAEARAAESARLLHETEQERNRLLVRAEAAEARVKELERLLGTGAVEWEAKSRAQLEAAGARVKELEEKWQAASYTADKLTEILGRPTATIGGYAAVTLVEAAQERMQRLEAAERELVASRMALSPIGVPQGELPALIEAVKSALNHRAEAAEARAEEYKRIGKQLEDDARKHFDQSCTNLKRAEAAEARVKELEANYQTALEAWNAKISARQTAQAEVKHAYACMQVAEIACRKAEKERDANWQAWSHSNEDREAAESRATQLARALKAARAWVASFAPSEERATDLGIIDAALSLAAPQGAPKKEGP